MMQRPDPQPTVRQIRGRAATFISAIAMSVGLMVQDWHPYGFRHMQLTVLILGVAIIATVSWPRGRRRERGRAGTLSGCGRDDAAVPAGTASRWPALSLMSRLMPRSAGRRWLAEAHSLLSEIAAPKRGAAIRSYLLSAPRLTVTMWARQLSRRARPGPRRPG